VDKAFRVEIDVYALYIILSVYGLFHVVYFVFFLWKYLRYGDITKEEEENERLRHLMQDTINEQRLTSYKDMNSESERQYR